MIDTPQILTGATGLLIGGILSWTMKSKIERTINVIKFLRRSFVPDKVKMVIVARTDLEMSKGKMAAQCAHAAVSCYAAAKKFDPDIVSVWESTGSAKVIVRCNVPAIIKDAGHTQLKSGTVTVLGIGPASAQLLDEVSGHLKLY